MIIWRIKVFFLRLINYLVSIPHRLFHLIMWLFWIKPLRGKHKLQRWFVGLLLLIVDLSPLPFLYETLLDWIKVKTRALNEKEKEIGLFVFGNKFPLHIIGLDPRSIPAIKKLTVAYASFHTINFDTMLPDATLIHEMVHIWQYQKYGAVYISEAFWAQKWGGGYNYGGLEPLKMYSEGLKLNGFNFEQQADIIEDYYRWSKNLPLQWSANVPGVGEVLTKYAKELKA